MKQVQILSGSKLIQKQTELNYELSLAGFQLGEEDIKTLYATMRKACKKYKMVESDPSILFRFVQMFYDSPYVNDKTLISTTQTVIDWYYGLRSLFPIALRDDDLLQVMKLAYLNHHGVMDQAMRKTMMKYCKKEVMPLDDSSV